MSAPSSFAPGLLLVLLGVLLLLQTLVGGLVSRILGLGSSGSGSSGAPAAATGSAALKQIFSTPLGSSSSPPSETTGGGALKQIFSGPLGAP